MQRHGFWLQLRLFLRHRSARTHVVLGYSMYMLLGWALLATPWAREDGQTIAAIDHLFIAASAVSTTGLVSISPADSYSFFGEIVILLLIQAGGIGYMTLGSVFVLSISHHWHRRQDNLVRTTFTLPKEFDTRRFVLNVVVFTLVIEGLGAVALWAMFRHLEVPNALWQALFHAVSAFCTAGFSLFNNSLEAFSDHIGVNIVIMSLSLLGAVGFIVMSDWWLALTRRGGQVGITSRIILRATFWGIAIGSAVLLATDSALAQLPATERLLAAVFQTVTALTTVGFNTYPISGLTASSLLILIIAMVMGASPSGTGGGLKSTTVASIFFTTRAQLRGEDEVRVFGRTLTTPQLRLAYAGLGFYLGLLLLGSFLLLLVDSQDFLSLVFEAASALGTVGLSLGATSDLSTLSKSVLVFLMWAGRIGPITLGMALFAMRNSSDPREGDGGPADIAL